MKKYLVTINILFLSFAACSTMQMQTDRIAGVKQVALTGFIVQEETPKGMELLSVGKKSGHEIATGSYLGKDNPYAQQMYEHLRELLSKEMKWTIVDRSEIAKNADYKALYDQSTQGWQNRPPVPINVESYSVPKITDGWNIQMMSPADRKKLIQSLGVDAIAVATVRIHLKEGGGLERVYGGGEYKPQARLSFALYDAATGEAIWQEAAADGPTVHQGVKHLLGAVSERDVLMQKSVEAARGAYRVLMKKYRDASSAAS